MIYPFIYILAYSLTTGRIDDGAIYFCPVNSRWRTTPRYSITPASGAYQIRSCAPCWVHSCMLCCVRSWPTLSKRHCWAAPFHLLHLLPTIFSAGFILFFITLQKLHLINSFWVYVLPMLFNFMHIVIIRTFLQGIPEELEESARIDGYGDFQIFVRIILPLSGPVLATISLFIRVAHWNDWFSVLTTYPTKI